MTAATLQGKHILITGGGTGIGLGCARQAISDGAVVTIVGRRVDVLEHAAEELRTIARDGGEVRTAQCDVTDSDAIKAAIEVATAGNDGRLDGAVANAGKGSGKPVLLLSADDLRDTFDPNVFGAFNTIREAATVMHDTGGSIVAISSIAGKLGGRFRAAYAASKAALDMLVKVSADELGPFGIRVNSVNPGLVPTEATAPLMDDDNLAEVIEDYLDQMPIRRLGTIDDVGGFVRFLLSDDASWITGQNLPVDGGHTIRRAPNLEHSVRLRMGDELVDRFVGPRWR